MHILIQNLSFPSTQIEIGVLSNCEDPPKGWLVAYPRGPFPDYSVSSGSNSEVADGSSRKTKRNPRLKAVPMHDIWVSPSNT
jgi:hypothetical protein